MIKDDVSKSEFGALSPYSIKTPDGIIIENYWQFLKVYENVLPIKCTFSTFDKRVVFTYGGGQHIDKNNEVTDEWNHWRKLGFACNDPVRFPVGSNPKARASCKFSLCINDDGTIDTHNRLDYVEARKKVYCKAYCDNVKLHKFFDNLKKRLVNGENLLIIEVDGPHQESLDYYKKTYGVDDDFIDNGTIEVNSSNMKIMLNDSKHAFGHGYCLAMELLGIRDDVI
ncbi:hypothetical protein BMW23_1028 [Bodo saltans virus]|uniref:Uncharacterized protein n=1 Tax=Bodo saltans virus TaxID=2024608 RepID=A0A2H4UVW7_9VIRU|nr:hypothetical protein QJ851_gp1010 [Bodo saltans virus]ATZ81073.1 hypothetical protein BMW23_1028 [Bodo saltans virus]